MVSSGFMAMLSIAAFLSAAWVATKISRIAGVSSIMLEIATGIVLGPQVLGLISEEYAVCQHKRHTNCNAPDNLMDLAIAGRSLGKDLDDIAAGSLCDRHIYEPWKSQGRDILSLAADAHEAAQGSTSHEAEHSQLAEGAGAVSHEQRVQEEGGHDAGAHHHRRLSGKVYKDYAQCLVRSCEKEVAHRCGATPGFFTLIGHAGVALMIFESGMHFDFQKATEVGSKAGAVAVLGTLLPLLTGCVLTVIYGKPFVPDGLSVGVALAPTSVGIALRLLGEAKVLDEDFGQAIITAAFGQDILSLVLFTMLFGLRGEFNVVSTVLFPFIGIVFMCLAILAATKFWPNFINNVIMPRIPEKPDSKVSPQDEALFLLMMMVLVAYATFTYFLGTHLWGCFLAGMSFACVNKHHWPHHVWVKQTKRASSWLIRIFFAATVAFSIPVAKFLSVEAFFKGSLMGLGPCILTKVLCAPFMGSAKFVIGWAMVGRAEFAYLIAQMAAAANMMDAETFSIVIWALLYATFFAPIVFRMVLDRYVKTFHAADGVSKGESDEEKVSENAH